MTELPLEFNVPPAVVWDYMTSPTKQLLWLADEERHESTDGIPGVGSRTHCVHGDMTRSRVTMRASGWRPDQEALLAEHREALFAEILRGRIKLVELLSGGVPSEAEVRHPS